jgi:hypothetical protein
MPYTVAPISTKITNAAIFCIFLIAGLSYILKKSCGWGAANFLNQFVKRKHFLRSPCSGHLQVATRNV